MRILLVAETDSFLKYAWALDEVLRADGIDCEISIIDGPLAPSAAQMSQVATRERSIGRLSARGTVRAVIEGGFDWTFLLTTGPVVAFLSSQIRRHRSTARLASLTPGIALPERARAMRARQFTDLFVVHSQLELMAYEQLIATMGLDTQVALTTLPLINGLEGLDLNPSLDCVFAAQPSVPRTFVERTQLLMLLGSGYERVGVKVRTVAGAGAQTHDEPFPYGPIAEVLTGRNHSDYALIEGPMSSALEMSEVLVTVSSTAALEAIAAGRLVRIIDDFGINSALINHVFIGSGLLGPAAEPPSSSPDPAWLEMNYFHDPVLNTLTDHLGRITPRRWSMSPAASRTFVKAVAQGYRKFSSLPGVARS